jgi:hypothetical protein
MNIYVASGHRTGSMHITFSLAKILDYQVTSGIPCFTKRTGADEHMITPMTAQTLFLLDRMVFHTHVKGTHGNVFLLEKFDMPVLITVRNLFDVMMSLKEKSDKGIHINGVPSPIPTPWDHFTEDDKWRWLALNAVPWELQFYASWALCPLNTRWVLYERFYADEVAGMIKILNWLNLPVDEGRVAAILKVDKTNLNVGGSGRGVKACPDFAKQLVYNQIDAWGSPFKEKMMEHLV